MQGFPHLETNHAVLSRRCLKRESRYHANSLEPQLDVGREKLAVSHIDKHALSKAMHVIRISMPRCRYLVPLWEGSMPGGATQLCLQSNLHPLARTYGSWIHEQILICALLTPWISYQKMRSWLCHFCNWQCISRPHNYNLHRRASRRSGMCSSRRPDCQAVGRRQKMSARWLPLLLGAFCGETHLHRPEWH